MPAMLRNIVVVIASWYVVHFVAWGSLGWADSFTNGRAFTVYFGWLSPGMVLSWAFPALVFACIGSLFVLLKVRPRPAWWALAFGALYGIDSFFHSTNRFYETATLFVYVEVYGRYLVPALAAWAGVVATQAFVRRVDVAS